MTPTALGDVTLAYELIWNQRRHCAGVRLLVEPHHHGSIDARQCLASLAQLWPQSAVPLLLHVRSPTLLNGLLEQRPTRGIWLEIPDDCLSTPTMVARVTKAQQGGWALVWRGAPGLRPTPALQAVFHQTLRSLTPQEALLALQLSRNPIQTSGASPWCPPSAANSSMYENLASLALLEIALDRQGVWAVAGWPVEEVLHARRLHPMQTSLQVLRSITQAIEADAPLDVLEHRLGNEPLLCYRFLRYATSAHLGARSEVTSLRQGLMVMGYTRLRAWLLGQMSRACADRNLDPIRFAMVLRARIMESLADAGAQDALRREVFLCGIFSQLDLLLGEPVGAAIHRLPLPGRIASAIVGQTGPYAAWLEVATALESNSTSMVRDVCRAHKLPAAEVNAALLCSLAAIGLPEASVSAPRANAQTLTRSAHLA